MGATEVGLGADGGTGFPAGWTKRGRGTRKKNPRKRGGGVGECISVSGRAGSRRRNRCRASWEGSWEVSCRSWKSCDGSRRLSRLVCADNWSGYGGTPSGPHPGEGRGVWNDAGSGILNREACSCDWSIQEETSYVGKGVRRWFPVVTVVSDARGRAAAAGCVVGPEECDVARPTRARKTS